MAKDRREQAFDEAPVVDAVVLEEAPVFDRDDGIADDGRNFVVGQEPADGTVLCVEQAGDKLRLEVV